MGPAAWRTAVATLVLMGVLASSAASGLRHAPPRAHAAVAIMHCGNNGCTETSTLTMAANGGLGATMTDNIPANATQASVTIAPICKRAADRPAARAAAARGTARAATCNDGSFTQLIDGLVDEEPLLAHLTPGKPETRLMGCVFIAAFLGKFNRALGGLQEGADSITAAVFLTCLGILAQEAGSTAHPGADTTPAASIAAQRCARLAQTVRVRFTKAGGKVQSQTVSSPQTSTGRTPVSISCKRAGAGLVITVKPTRRGQKLPKVIGPTVGIGYVNPGPLPAAVKTTFKVN
jgi:hypothetical protein